MALIHDVKREIHAKIVYYGPGCSGKTTNLEYVYNKLKPEYRGAFKFMNTPHGRMVFFDFMRPELAGIKDYSLHFHLYTVPGNTENAALWKNVLKGVDGIVFVADLDPARTLENVRSLESLQNYLAGHGLELSQIPCIVQCNKKDLSGALSPDDIKALLDAEPAKFVSASARGGEGVLPVLSEMVKLVIQKLRDLPINSEEDAEQGESVTPLAADGLATQDNGVALESPQPTLEREAYFPETMRFPACGEESSSQSDLPESSEDDFKASDAVAQEEVPAVTQDVEEPAPPSEEFETTDLLQEPGDFPAPIADTHGDAVFSLSAPVQEEAEIHEPILSLEQGLTAVGDGQYTQTIVVRCGGSEKRFVLTLGLTIE